MSKIIYSGLESSGKSLRLAMDAQRILRRNTRWLKKTGKARPICSNMEFSIRFKDEAKRRGIPIVIWENLDDLVQFSNCDVFIDEIGTYFDSRMWTDLSLDVRRWISQAAKSSVEIYGAAQDFSQIDISFRRLVNELYHITKIVGSPRPAATRLPVKRIWGVCMKRKLDPRDYVENQFKTTGWFPTFFLIEREYCEIFDTLQFIKKSKPLLYKHVERFCEDPDCAFHKTEHR